MKDPLFEADSVDCIHKLVQVFLHSCNTTAIKDVDLGDLAEFGGRQKKSERGEWLTLTPGWVDRPAPKKEGRQKSDRRGIGDRSSSGGGGRDAVFNNRVYLQLQIVERLRYMTAAARSKNLR